MSTIRSWFAAITVGLLAGCYILIEPENKPEPEVEKVYVPYPVEVPVEVPVGIPDPSGSPAPSSLQSGGLLVLWMVRIDIGAATLSQQYEQQVDRLRQALTAASLPIEAEVVLSAYDGRTLWARSWDVPAPVKLSTALAYYGAQASSTALPCTTRPLQSVAMWLESLRVDYPEELVTQASSPDGAPSTGTTPVERSGTILKRAPGGVVVMFIDSGPRPYAPTASACATELGGPPEYFGGYSPAKWVYYAGRQYLREQTKFGFIATQEQVADQQSLEQCLRNPDFPRAALDAISTSDVPFFDPMNQALQPLSRRYDFCEAITGQWDADGFAQELRASLLQVSP